MKPFSKQVLQNPTIGSQMNILQKGNYSQKKPNLKQQTETYIEKLKSTSSYQQEDNFVPDLFQGEQTDLKQDFDKLQEIKEEKEKAFSVQEKIRKRIRNNNGYSCLQAYYLVQQCDNIQESKQKQDHYPKYKYLCTLEDSKKIFSVYYNPKLLDYDKVQRAKSIATHFVKDKFGKNGLKYLEAVEDCVQLKDNTAIRLYGYIIDNGNQKHIILNARGDNKQSQDSAIVKINQMRKDYNKGVEQIKEQEHKQKIRLQLKDAKRKKDTKKISKLYANNHWLQYYTNEKNLFSL